MCKKNVQNVSFTGVESKKSPQIVFYKLIQCKNISRNQLPPLACTPFDFWNVTSITFDRLDVLVYPQNRLAKCVHMLVITFRNVSQLYLHHCNITVAVSSLMFFSSVYLSHSEFVTVAFSTIICHQENFYRLKNMTEYS